MCPNLPGITIHYIIYNIRRGCSQGVSASAARSGKEVWPLFLNIKEGGTHYFDICAEDCCMAPQWTVRKEACLFAGKYLIARGKNSPPAVLRGGVFMCLSERRGAEKNIILPKKVPFLR